MAVAFYILAALLVWFSYRSFRGGIAYLTYFEQELAKPVSSFTPFVSVIAPCRGIDEGLGENLSALLHQDYPQYEVIFVVDDTSDPAVAVIDAVRRKAATEEAPRERIKMAVAAKAATSSQKVENLREAVLHADERSEVLVFVDSDARPSQDWLRTLVAPLKENEIGAATGYRWFISERPGFASELRSVWNASVASALGPNESSNFCWGGSLAIRRKTYEMLNLRERLSSVVSDDFTITRAVRENGLRIRFVPNALTPSLGGCTFRELVEFTNRQMAITRVYAAPLWLSSLLGSLLFVIVMTSAFAVAVFSRQNSMLVWMSLLVLGSVSAFSIAKSLLRLRAAELVLSEHRRLLRKQRFFQSVLWTLTPYLFLTNCIAALFSRSITWRGTRYYMHSADNTSVLPLTDVSPKVR